MAVVALMATGCQKDRSFDGLILLAEGYNGNGTKLEVNGLSSEWAVGDEVFIKGAEGEGQTAIVNNTGNAQTSVSLANDPGFPYYGVYPSSIYSDNTGSSFTLNLPSTYDYAVSGGKQNLGSPMVAYASSGNTLAFKHLTAAITVHFVNYYGFTVQIDSIEVISDKYKLSGTLSNLTIGSGTPDISAVQATTDAEKVVKMYGGASLQVFAGDSINVQVPVLPVGSDNHFTIKTYVHKVDQSAVVATIEKAQTTGGALARAGLGYARLATPGLFSVSASKKVVISQGNLQYIGSAASPYWKFAETQYGYLGSTTGQNSSDVNKDRDLFGWGTSGWNNGNTNFMPYNTATTSSTYGPKSGSTYYDLTGDYDKSDWGVYNAIYNGGNRAGMWRTPADGEWTYLFANRTSATSKYGCAKVNDVAGLIILPDDFTDPMTNSGSAAFVSAESSIEFTLNTYSIVNWVKMEAAGAVFLPFAGYRNGTTVQYTAYTSTYGCNLCYWSSTHKGSNSAYHIYFSLSSYGTKGLNTHNSYNGVPYGQSVRLIREI